LIFEAEFGKKVVGEGDPKSPERVTKVAGDVTHG
jgi:hypothetical protein